MVILRLLGQEGIRTVTQATFNNEDSKSEEKVYNSEALFGGKKLVWVRHGEELYKLMITKYNKLILMK